MDFNQNQRQPWQFQPDAASSRRPVPAVHNFMPVQAPTGALSGNNRQQNFMNQLNQNIQTFWRDHLAEIDSPAYDPRAHVIPVARVKKIIKSDDDVKMLSADTPVVAAKACQLFMKELTMRSWMHTQVNKRRTLQRDDVANAVRDDELLTFLRKIVPLVTNPEEAPVEQNNPGVQQPGYAQNINVPPTIPYPNMGLHLGNHPMNIQGINEAFGVFLGDPMQQNRGPVLRPPNPQGQPPPPGGANPYPGFQ